ncbi:MAG TPA: multicopper oxidase domain-containing protein [Rugosimonospora sp.]|nr:multicopper oxidase domain-containing protein [Rugosimonospora sp.]
MVTRRKLVKAGVVAGGASLVPAAYLLRGGQGRAQAATRLDPTTIAKYVTPLFVTPAMPRVSSSPEKDVLAVAARQISQQMLPSGMPATTVFAFGAADNPATFRSPSYTIEATADRTTLVTWSNELVTADGDYLPPLVTVDQTLHWANPPGGTVARDSAPVFTTTPTPYTGPVPLVVHLHGQHAYEESDGYPEAWFLPKARNIPDGYATVGSFYDRFAAESKDRWGVPWSAGNSVYGYPNDQRATTLWYHDHSLGMTRTGVYSGLAGLYLLRGGPSDLPAGALPGPAPQPGDPDGTKYFEIPLVLQDRSFNADGTTFYPTTRADSTGPFIPGGELPPNWLPVALGDTMTVNGNTWPYLEVEPRRYRFRVLNASNIRPITLKVVADPLAARPAPAALPIWAIGSDGGFLPKAVSLTQLPIFSAERYDIIIDFTGLAPGKTLYLSNEGAPTSPATTGQVMQFRVVAQTGPDTSTPPDQLSLPGYKAVGAASNTRKLSLSMNTVAAQNNIPKDFMLGTVKADGTAQQMGWHDPISEFPAENSTEVWEFHNFAPGGHAVHVHLVEFQVIERQPIAGGAVTPPGPHETGDKDVVFAPPRQITRVKATYDRKGRYVWHCHFLEHEDHDMMRPFEVR